LHAAWTWPVNPARNSDDDDDDERRRCIRKTGFHSAKAWKRSRARVGTTRQEERINLTVTLAKLRRHGRRLDRLNLSVTTTLAAMRAGAVLHLEYHHGRAWYLSNGRSVPDEVAKIVILNKDVADVDLQYPTANVAMDRILTRS
jgi:hypothetical protein